MFTCLIATERPQRFSVDYVHVRFETYKETTHGFNTAKLNHLLKNRCIWTEWVHIVVTAASQD
jgi:hypothetical protein